MRRESYQSLSTIANISLINICLILFLVDVVFAVNSDCSIFPVYIDILIDWLIDWLAFNTKLGNISAIWWRPCYILQTSYIELDIVFTVTCQLFLIRYLPFETQNKCAQFDKTDKTDKTTIFSAKNGHSPRFR